MLTPFFDSILEDDAIMPAQFFDLHRARQLSPERRLLLNVLADAVELISGSTRNSDGVFLRGRARLIIDARLWVQDEAPDTPWGFTFTAVCGHLGIDAGALRKRLLAGEPVGAMPRYRTRKAMLGVGG